MGNNTRIYEDKVNIDKDSVKNFWNNRAKVQGLKSVLLGNQQDNSHNDLRNKDELSLLKKFAQKNFKECTILDIGCGIGRWAENLKNEIKLYHGVDYCEAFIQNNIKKFEKYKNIDFYTMSIDKIDKSILCDTYDILILNGILMYINDDIILDIFSQLKTFQPTLIYLQESVSTTGGRMTLNNFYSEELKSNYSAIYRNKEEYETYIAKVLTNYKICESGFLLNSFTGAKKETNAYWWFIRKDEINDKK